MKTFMALVRRDSKRNYNESIEGTVESLSKLALVTATVPITSMDQTLIIRRVDLTGSERLGGVNTVGIHACTRTQFDSMFTAVGEQVSRAVVVRAGPDLDIRG